jgi:hypothetical protein
LSHNAPVSWTSVKQIEKSLVRFIIFKKNVFTTVLLCIFIIGCIHLSCGAIVYLPTGEIDSLKRLRYSFKDYNRIRSSTFPIASFYALFFLGCVFSWITKTIIKKHFIPAGISSFPGPQKPLTFLGKHKCVDIIASSGLQEGNAGNDYKWNEQFCSNQKKCRYKEPILLFCLCTGLAFLLVSYVDHFRVALTGDTSVVSKEDLRKLAKLVEKYIEDQHQLVCIGV